MIYTVGAILAALGSLAAWVYHLLQKVQTLKETAAQRDQADHTKEWIDKINQQNSTIEEDIRNYEKAKSDFNSDNPPPSGAV